MMEKIDASKKGASFIYSMECQYNNCNYFLESDFFDKSCYAVIRDVGVPRYVAHLTLEYKYRGWGQVQSYCGWPLLNGYLKEIYLKCPKILYMASTVKCATYLGTPTYIHWKSSLNNSSKVDTKKYSNYNNTTAVAFGGTVTEIFRQQNQLSIISLVFQIKTPGRSHMKTISIQHSVKSNGSQKSF